MDTAVETTSKAIKERTPTLLEQAILIDWYQETLQRFLGTQEAVDAFTAEVFTQARKAPKLYGCSIESTRFVIARIASLKLNPAIPNEVALIPRNMKQPNGRYVDEMTVIYGYGGLRKLAMRSPEVKDVLTAAVCVNDRYVCPPDMISLPIHAMPEGFKPRGRVIGYYAAAQLANGNWRTWPMSVAEVEAHAKRYVHDLDRAPAWSKGKRPDTDDGLTAFDKMAMKTCLRMLLNGRDIPLSAEVVEAIQEEESALHVETPGERLGYTQGDHRPALTMGTGVTMEELMQDLTGGKDEADAALVEARKPKPSAKAKSVEETKEGPRVDTSAEDTTLWREILRANLSFLQPGEIRSEAVAALENPQFPDQRGNELASLASDLASRDDD